MHPYGIIQKHLSMTECSHAEQRRHEKQIATILRFSQDGRLTPPHPNSPPLPLNSAVKHLAGRKENHISHLCTRKH